MMDKDDLHQDLEDIKDSLHSISVQLSELVRLERLRMESTHCTGGICLLVAFVVVVVIIGTCGFVVSHLL